MNTRTLDTNEYSKTYRPNIYEMIKMRYKLNKHKETKKLCKCTYTPRQIECYFNKYKNKESYLIFILHTLPYVNKLK